MYAVSSIIFNSSIQKRLLLYINFDWAIWLMACVSDWDFLLLHLKLFICSHFSRSWYGTEMWQPFCCLHTVYLLLLPKVLMICKTPTFVRRKSSKCPCHLKPFFFSSFFCQINALGNSSVVIHIFFSFEANWSVKNHVLSLVCDTNSVDC